MSPKPTVYDVARDSGFSIATVSRALRHPQGVRQSTQEAIARSVTKLGYVPSGSAQSLAAKKTGVIGLFLPTIDASENLDSFDLVKENRDDVVIRQDIQTSADNQLVDSLYYEEVLRGCEFEAWKQGLSLMVNVARGHSSSDVSQLIIDMAGKVDAIIVLARSIPDSSIDFLAKRLPVVIIADTPSKPDVDYDFVRVSNRKGMKALVEHLVDQHAVRSFAYLAGPDDSPDNFKRFSGFEEALAGRDINPASMPIYRGQFSRQTAAKITADLIAADQLPRALVCANDQMALGALSELSKAGVRVPDDVIVTGFDDIDEARISTPRLTTINQPMLALGRAAVSTVVTRLADSNREPIFTELPVTLLLRESCEGEG